MKILVVCGAGASSTFVAQRLGRAAQAAGLDWHTSAGTVTSLTADAFDLVLVGPHLADRITAIRASAHCPAVALPADVFADRDGDRTLAFTQSALADITPRRPPLKGTS